MLCITALVVIAAALCLQVVAIANDPFYGVEFTPGGRVIYVRTYQAFEELSKSLTRWRIL